MGDLTALLVAAGLLAANAFFVGAEFALVSARRTQIEPAAAAGSRVARITLRAMEKVSLVMAGAQLGITVSSLGLGALAEPAVAHLVEPLFHAVGVPEGLLHPVALVLAMSVVVYLHVVVGEMVPKNLALAAPERSAMLLGPPMMLVVTALRPVVVVLNAIANGVLRVVGIEPKDEVTSAFTRGEVAALVDESRGEGLLPEDEYDRLSGALGFTERTVMSVLMSNDDLATVPLGATVGQVEAVCAATGFSRFPVSANGELTGYVHIKDVVDTDPASATMQVHDKWVRPFASVRSGDLLHEALECLQRQGAHMGRVVEEDGTVLGLVTLEDVLEELVGEIRDAAHTPE